MKPEHELLTDLMAGLVEMLNYSKYSRTELEIELYYWFLDHYKEIEDWGESHGLH